MANKRPRGTIIELEEATGLARIQLEDSEETIYGAVNMKSTEESALPNYRRHDLVEFDISMTPQGKWAVAISNVTLIDAVEERILNEHGEFPRGDGGLRE
jgi:hypothetical protein